MENQRYIKMLKSETDPALRRFAARKLHEADAWRDEEAEILVESLKDSDLGVKDICSLALSEAKHQKAIIAAKKLSALLSNDELEIRALAAEILEKIGAPASEYVIEYLKSDDPKVRKISLEILSRIKDHKTINNIAVALKDKDSNVVSFAIEALGNLKAIKYVKEITDLFFVSDDYKLYVIEALGKIGGAESHHFLKELLLNESDIIIKTSVIDALSYCCNDNEAVELLKNEFPKARKEARGLFLKAIMAISSRSGKVVEFDENQRDLCVECLKDEEADIRAAALLALGGLYKNDEVDIIFKQFIIESKEIQRYILLNILANNSEDIVKSFFEKAFAIDASGDTINDILSILPFVYPTASEENAKIALEIICAKSVKEQLSFYKDIYDTVIQLDYNIAIERLKNDILSNNKLIVESAIEVAIAYNLKDVAPLLEQLYNSGILSESYLDDAKLRLSW